MANKDKKFGLIKKDKQLFFPGEINGVDFDSDKIKDTQFSQYLLDINLSREEKATYVSHGFWTSLGYEYDQKIYVKSELHNNGDWFYDFLPTHNICGIRPIIPYSAIKKNSTVISDNGIELIIECGVIPTRKRKYTKNTGELAIPIGQKYVFPVIKNVSPLELNFVEFEEVKFKNDPGRYIMCPNNKDVFCLEPLRWKVLKTSQIAITENIIAYSPYMIHVDKYDYFIVEAWIEDYFPTLVLNTEYNLEEEETIPVSKSSEDINEAEDLIRQINLLTLNMNNDYVTNLLNELTANFNAKLEELKKAQRTQLNTFVTLDIASETPENVFNNFVFTLKELKQKVEKYLSSSVGKQYQIICDCISLIKGGTINYTPDDLIDTVEELRSIIIPSLPEKEQKEYLEYLLKIFETEKSEKENQFNEYIKTDKMPKESSNLNVRKSLIVFLEKLSIDTSRNYIMENLKNIISGIYKENNSSIVTKYFNEINLCLKRIKDLASQQKQKEYIDLAKSLLKNNQTMNDNIKQYLSKIGIDCNNIAPQDENMYILMYIYIQLAKLELELEEYKNRIENIENLKINI